MSVAVPTDNTSRSVEVKTNTSEAAPLRGVTCAPYAALCVVRRLVKQTDRRTVVTAIHCGWSRGFVNLQKEKRGTEIKPECGTVQKS